MSESHTTVASVALVQNATCFTCNHHGTNMQAILTNGNTFHVCGSCAGMLAAFFMQLIELSAVTCLLEDMQVI